MRPFSHSPSKPASSSDVTSGPMSGSPRFCGTSAAFPAHTCDVHVRVASNAPGARPDWPYAVRSLSEPQLLFQKLSSDNTQEALAFGYICSPKPEPNALLPSTRRPTVTK